MAETKCIESRCNAVAFAKGRCKKHYNKWHRSRPGYYTWAQMINRCQVKTNPHFYRYGARGITVCQRWRIYKNFIADMGVKPPGCTMDRIDNSGNYEPSNCRWATSSEQARNRTSNIVIKHNGEQKILIEWAEHIGIPYSTLHSRIFAYGWSIQRALTEPLRAY